MSRILVDGMTIGRPKYSLMLPHGEIKKLIASSLEIQSVFDEFVGFDVRDDHSRHVQVIYYFIT